MNTRGIGIPSDYRLDIVGLRAVAVFAVILHHLNLTLFQNGFLGVDIFFIISGYVVTKSITVQIERDAFSLKEFYASRILRLLPALYLMLFAVCIAAFFLLQPTQIAETLSTAFSAIILLANVNLYFETGYFASNAITKPLLHMWSLSIEEQFYLVYPILTYIVLSKWTLHYRILVLFFIVVTTFSLTSILNFYKPSFTFYMMPFRIWELCLGSFCFYLNQAIQGKNYNSWLSDLTNNLAFIALLTILSVPVISIQSPGIGTILPAIFVSILLVNPAREATYHSALTSGPLLAIGAASYSLYLWHQPIIAFSHSLNYEQTITYKTLLLVIIACFAAASYYFVELPLRSNANNISKSKKVTWIGGISLLLASILYIFSSNDRHVDLWKSLTTTKRVELYKVLNNRSYLHVGDTDGITSYNLNGNCKVISSEFSAQFQAELLRCAAKSDNLTLIIGDSHAMNVFNGFAYNSRETASIFAFTRPRWRPSAQNFDANELFTFLNQHAHLIDNIIYSQSGRYLLEHDGDVPTRALLLNHPTNNLYQNINLNIDAIQDTTDFVNQLPEFAQKDVIFYGPRPEPYVSDKSILKNGCDFQAYVNHRLVEKFSELDSLLRKKFESTPINYTSQFSDLKLTFPDDFMNCFEIYWADGDHYSTAGERHFFSRSQLLLYMVHQNAI